MAIELTTISDKILFPDGSAPAAGSRIEAKLSQLAAAIDGAASDLILRYASANIGTDGSISFQLTPTDVLDVEGLYYTLTVHTVDSAGGTHTDVFKATVPSNPDPIGIGALGRIEVISGSAVGFRLASSTMAGVVKLAGDLGGTASAPAVANVTNALVTATDSTTARAEKDRWADVFNVKNFGAVGDGTTDDTEAIRAAVAAIVAARVIGTYYSVYATRLYFPAGSYRITDTIDFTLGSGANSIGLNIEGAGRGDTNIVVDVGTSKDGIIIGGLMTLRHLTFVSPSSAASVRNTIVGADGGSSQTFDVRMERVSNVAVCTTAAMDLPATMLAYFDSCKCYGTVKLYATSGTRSAYETQFVNCQFYNYYTSSTPALWLVSSRNTIVVGGNIVSLTPSTSASLQLDDTAGSVIASGVDFAYSGAQAAGWDVISYGQMSTIGCMFPARAMNYPTSGSVLVKSTARGGLIAGNLWLGTQSVYIESGATGLSLLEGNLAASSVSYAGSSPDAFPGAVHLKDALFSGGRFRAAGGVSPGTPAGATQTGYVYQGSGAPSASYGSNGDIYFRTDTPGTANQRIYVRSAGSWVGIL